MPKKKPVWSKPRPAKLGKPKKFNTKSAKYKSVRAKADRKFGKKTSLVKNMYIATQLKKRKK